MQARHASSRALIAVGAPALVVTLGVGGVLVTAPRTDGPLIASSAISVEFALARSRTGTWGVVLPTNPTSSVITIEGIEALDARGIEIVGMLINDPARDGGIGTLDAFPPPGMPFREVAGTDVPPMTSAGPHRQLLVGVRLTGADPGSIGALRLRYRHAGATYEVTLPYALRIRPAGG
jgi:hypothetical protein